MSELHTKACINAVIHAVSASFGVGDQELRGVVVSVAAEGCQATLCNEAPELPPTAHLDELRP